jgi:2-oxoglutarate ferredoxin oxidoreductase subunit delta
MAPIYHPTLSVVPVIAVSTPPLEESGIIPLASPGPILTPPAVQATPPSPPTSPDKQKSAMPEVIFAENLCKGCELCITVCPTKILKLDTSRVNLRGYNPAIVYNLAECSGCGSCAKICPDSVITVRR